METAFYSEIKCQPAALRATLAAYEKNDFALIKEAIAPLFSGACPCYERNGHIV